MCRPLGRSPCHYEWVSGEVAAASNTEGVNFQSVLLIRKEKLKNPQGKIKNRSVIMSNPNIRLLMQQDQLTWFLDLLLDERELFQLSASTGIVLDVDRLYALSRRELLVNLADVFLDVVGTTKSDLKNPEPSSEAPDHEDRDRAPAEVKTLVSQFLSEKAQAAISRVGYMEVSEIETFFKTSDVLIEGGDFGEVVWALLTDQRTAVVEHGYKLLNTTYDAIEAAHTNGSGNVP